MSILLIETATPICSIALEDKGVITIERHSDQPNAHSSKLAVFIDEIFNSHDSVRKELEAVCVSSGPGSYTGLRIGVSSAKGLCYALGVPLIAVPTLQNMANQFFEEHKDYQGLVCPMIDARRMECYTAIYSREGVVKETSAEVIESGIYDQWLNSGTVTFIGDGAEKTRPLLSTHPYARYNSDFRISASGMMLSAREKLAHGEIEDTAYFEPFYLKDFVAKKSEVHGLRR